jgi:Na+/H+-dicarboxylate symporter
MAAPAVQLTEQPSKDGERRHLLAEGASMGDGRVATSDEASTSEPRHSRFLSLLRAEPLLFQTLAGVLCGVVLGSVVHAAAKGPLPRTARELLGLPGELFMRALKCLVLPLITGSALSGVLSVLSTASKQQARGLARRTLLLYVASMQCAVTVGIVCMSLFRPGKGVTLGDASCDAPGAATPQPAPVSGLDALLTTLRSVVPPNIFAAAASGNVLGLLALAIATALAIGAGGEEDVQVSLRAVTAFNAVVARMVTAVLHVMPVCICSLIASQIAGTCHPLRLLSSLSYFIAVYFLGLVLHAGVVIPLALRLVGGLSPRAVYRGASPALVTVFATDSSSATLPVTLMCCKERLRIPSHIVDFVIPLGTTINMDGTALYEATAVLFIAQVHGVQLGVVGTVVLSLTATLAAVGAPAIPSAGTVTMLIVLQACGLEVYSADIAVLLAVDWLLDRLRSMVNVVGDVAVCAIVSALATRDVPRDAEDGS